MLNFNIAPKIGVDVVDLKNIKNIIFDLGNVVIDIHYNRTLEAFRELGFPDFEKAYSLFKQSNLFTLLETGKIQGTEFCNSMRKMGLDSDDDTIKNAWSMMLGELTAENYELLKSIRKNYKTYLLSNTNEIHIDFFVKGIVKVFGRNVLPEMFDKIYYSHQVQLRKPNVEIYQYVLKDAGLNPRETIFIDDLLENVEAARKAGILGYHLENERIGEIFKEILN
jgi:putative hydrolase of the HAD superfamily